MDFLTAMTAKSVGAARSIAYQPGKRAAFLAIALAAISASAPPGSVGTAVALFQVVLWCALAVACAAVVSQLTAPKSVHLLLYSAIFVVWAGVLVLEVLPKVA